MVMAVRNGLTRITINRAPMVLEERLPQSVVSNGRNASAALFTTAKAMRQVMADPDTY